MTDDRTADGIQALLDAPIFVSQPARQFLEEEANPAIPARIALFSLCELVEATVRFVAVATSLDIAASSDGAKAPRWLTQLAAKNLPMPTFGKWIAFLRELAARGASQTFPKFVDAETALSALAPRVDDDAKTEWTSIVWLRNAIAHGGGVPDELARALLMHWRPRVSNALCTLPWVHRIQVWVHETGQFERLDGPDAESRAEDPPDEMRSALPEGGVGLWLDGRGVLLYPLIRHQPIEPEGRPHVQLFARQAPAGLVYLLFGAPNALQQTSGPDELDAFYRLFDLAAIRRIAAKLPFNEPGYDEQFESQAATFVGRAQARGDLMNAVRDATGIVYVTGPAGIGKSSLISTVSIDLRDRLPGSTHGGQSMLMYRFIDGDRGCAPLPFLRWLIERLDKIVGGGAKVRSSHALHELREIAITRLSKAPRQRIVLVLDNLDELARRHQRFAVSFVRRLAGIDDLLVLIGSRPEADLPAVFAEVGGRTPFPTGLPGMSKTELRTMLLELLPGITKPIVKQDLADTERANAFIDAMAERADGLPLYVRLVVDALMRSDNALNQAMQPGWLPAKLENFFIELTSSGPFSLKASLTLSIGVLLALAREPLSSEEIGALVSRMQSASRAARLSERGIDIHEQRRTLSAEIMQDLGGLLRASLDADGVQRYRLLHDSLVQHILTTDDLADEILRLEEFLGRQAMAPGDDAATRYLCRHGVAHILNQAYTPKEGGEQAAALLSDFAYQITRLERLAGGGGDGGLREDWQRIAETGASLDESTGDWRWFWSTDGAFFAVDEGRNGARELIERALHYDPESTFGTAVDAYLRTREEDNGGPADTAGSTS